MRQSPRAQHLKGAKILVIKINKIWVQYFEKTGADRARWGWGKSSKRRVGSCVYLKCWHFVHQEYFFCIDFLKYCIKIAFISMTEILGAPWNFTPKKCLSVLPKPQPWASFAPCVGTTKVNKHNHFFPQGHNPASLLPLKNKWKDLNRLSRGTGHNIN